MAENKIHIIVPSRCNGCPEATTALFSVEKRGNQVFVVPECPSSAFCEKLFNRWNDLLRKKLEEMNAPFADE